MGGVWRYCCAGGVGVRVTRRWTAVWSVRRLGRASENRRCASDFSFHDSRFTHPHYPAGSSASILPGWLRNQFVISVIWLQNLEFGRVEHRGSVLRRLIYHPAADGGFFFEGCLRGGEVGVEVTVGHCSQDAWCLCSPSPSSSTSAHSALVGGSLFLLGFSVANSLCWRILVVWGRAFNTGSWEDVTELEVMSSCRARFAPSSETGDVSSR